jgi:carbonic anhydrase/acetyltransferase-like protein (isoleucine patch superfamily)
VRRFPSLKAVWRWLWTQSYWRLRFARVGKRTILFAPTLVVGARYISIGAHSTVRDQARLETIHSDQKSWLPRLSIGDRVNIEQGVHIVCQCEVIIGNDVSITPYCAIVDTDHPYDPPDASPKIGARLPQISSYVRIGDGTFVGAHSIILPNVTIGRGCVIGAGSVVSRDLPDYSVCAGSPARILKQFDPKTRKWTQH